MTNNSKKESELENKDKQEAEDIDAKEHKVAEGIGEVEEIVEDVKQHEKNHDDPKRTADEEEQAIQLQHSVDEIVDKIIKETEDRVKTQFQDVSALEADGRNVNKEFKTAHSELKQVLNDIQAARKSDEKKIKKKDWRELKEGIKNLKKAAADLNDLTNHWGNLVFEYHNLLSEEGELEELVREEHSVTETVEKELKVGDQEARKAGDRQADQEFRKEKQQEDKIEAHEEAEMSEVKKIRQKIAAEKNRINKDLKKHYNQEQRVLKEAQNTLGTIYKELDHIKKGGDRNGGRASRMLGRATNMGQVNEIKRLCRQTAKQIEKMMRKDEEETQNEISKIRKEKVKGAAKKGGKISLLVLGAIIAAIIGFIVFMM